nr:beta-galactosidase trimerization domain-containing protein [Planctomycetota bacterium]
DLAFNVRWDLPDHLALRAGYVDEIAARAAAATHHLSEVMAGRAPDLAVPPHPDFAKLTLDGRYFREGAEPRILFSMQYHSSGELMKWFGPEGFSGWISAVGASRYDFHESPIWPVYQADPGTHRVYDDSWCGHIIRDQNSAGGTDRCVINLDHPRMRLAIAESIASMCAPFAKRGLPLFLNLGFEYSYVDYSAWSAEKFRGWLAAKYHGIAELNAIWKTTYADFSAIDVPSFDSTKPETNSARYYDWGDFNLWRFTDFMAWAKGEVRTHLPAALTTTGGGEPFGAGFWRQGLDEEGLFNAGVTDLFLSETGSRALGVTSVMDLQRSLANRPALILDPEYHARGNTCSLMFFHGCGVMDYWWWPDEVDDFYDSSMKHSPVRPLSEVATVLQTALDVRRLARYFAPFPDAPAEIALLYSRASLIQKHPGATGDKTPYSFEVERTFEAATTLDAPVGFVSSQRVLAGIPPACKIVVIPGCRFMEEGVFEHLTKWVSQGGTLVVTPSSLVADEYGRKRDYLARLGIEVTAEEVPEFLAGPAKRGIEQTGELDFIQGPVVKTLVTKAPARAITAAAGSLLADPPEPVSAAGVIQTVTPDAHWTVEASYSGDGAGGPAVLSRTMGAGRVIYLAAQLSLPSQRCFFDRLMDRVGCARPIRALTPTGGAPAGVESRTVPFEGGLLTYVVNTTEAPVPVVLTAKQPIGALWNLSADVAEPSTTITLAPYETRILRSKPAPAQR